jgi:hypothetical protein
MRSAPGICPASIPLAITRERETSTSRPVTLPSLGQAESSGVYEGASMLQFQSSNIEAISMVSFSKVGRGSQRGFAWKNVSFPARIIASVIFSLAGCSTSYAEPVRLEIVTAILQFDPQAGMKSTQVLFVDFEKKQVTQSFSTGVTTLGPVDFGSVRDKFNVANVDFSSAGRVGFTARGQTASGVLFMPNINYRFHLAITRNGKGALTGCHDGYPAYQVIVGKKMIYSYKHPSISLFKLFGQCDIEIKNAIEF